MTQGVEEVFFLEVAWEGGYDRSSYEKSGVFFNCLSKRWCLTKVRARMGEGRRRCPMATWDKGAEGVHKGHFQIPAGMVVFLCSHVTN